VAAAIPSILAQIPRKAFGYLLIFVIAEIVENVTPYPRSEIGGYLIFAVWTCGAIALSSFLKLVPVKMGTMRRIAWAAALIIGLLMYIAVLFAWPRIPYSSLIMVFWALLIYLVRTARPDLLLKEEELEQKERQKSFPPQG
jgi:phosphatidylserine synthase